MNKVDPSGLMTELNDELLSNTAAFNNLNFIDRNLWSSTSPDFSRGLNLNSVGYNRITLHHSGSRDTARSVQNLHMNNGEGAEKLLRDTIGNTRIGSMLGVQSYDYADTGYHFMVDSAGTVFEGRDLNYQGAHVIGGNPGNIGVAFLGDYTSAPLSDAQFLSGSRLVYSLAMTYGISSGSIYTHGDFDQVKQNELLGAMNQINRMRGFVRSNCITLNC